jgi:hypothetical protein
VLKEIQVTQVLKVQQVELVVEERQEDKELKVHKEQ